MKTSRRDGTRIKPHFPPPQPSTGPPAVVNATVERILQVIFQSLSSGGDAASVTPTPALTLALAMTPELCFPLPTTAASGIVGRIWLRSLGKWYGMISRHGRAYLDVISDNTGVIYPEKHLRHIFMFPRMAVYRCSSMSTVDR